METLNNKVIAAAILKQILHDAWHNKKQREILRDELQDHDYVGYWEGLCEYAGLSQVEFFGELRNALNQ